jgi:hypothetical protein
MADPPPDPELTATARARREQAEEQQRAAAAALAEQEQRVLAIESAQRQSPYSLSDDELDQLLGYYCSDCHLKTNPEMNYSAIDGLFDLDDLDKMIAIGKITPGDGEGSRLVLRVRAGEMPPAQSGQPPVPEAIVDAIVDYIDNLPSDTPPAD